MERLPDAKRQVIEQYFDLDWQDIAVTKPEYGHMAYSRFLLETPDGRSAFAKIHDECNYVARSETEKAFVKERSQNDLKYLEGEAVNLAFINRHTQDISPQLYTYKNGVLLMERFYGAEWWLPNEKYLDKYVEDCFKAFDELPKTPRADASLQMDGQDIISLRSNNWEQIDVAKLPREPQQGFERRQEVGAKAIYDLAIDTPAHHDSRQTNIAWWRDGGAKLIDFSWLNLGPKNADSTILLIDLAKYGHDVRKYLPGRFNENYAWLRAGNWLNRACLPPSPEREKVRAAQLKSATVALELIDLVG